ncbi:MAG: hypothetical protein IJY78_01470, partial [Bacteroidaceae bacterium]|nr:hypothetical protein [Bacteroidaceae bacterium]
NKKEIIFSDIVLILFIIHLQSLLHKITLKNPLRTSFLLFYSQFINADPHSQREKALWCPIVGTSSICEDDIVKKNKNSIPVIILQTRIFCLKD